jgi:uncharacterized membrane protein
MGFITRFVNAIVEVHPLHSMTVHFPIALTGTAFLFLVLALWRRNETLELAAFYLIALAGLSTIIAGLTGYRDNIVRFEGEAPLVNAKVFLAVTLFVLTLSGGPLRWWCTCWPLQVAFFSPPPWVSWVVLFCTGSRE